MDDAGNYTGKLTVKGDLLVVQGNHALCVVEVVEKQLFLVVEFSQVVQVQLAFHQFFFLNPQSS